MKEHPAQWRWLPRIVVSLAVLGVLLNWAGLFGVTLCECWQLYTPTVGVKLSPSSLRVYLVGGVCSCYPPLFAPPSEWHWPDLRAWADRWIPFLLDWLDERGIG